MAGILVQNSNDGSSQPSITRLDSGNFVQVNTFVATDDRLILRLFGQDGELLGSRTVNASSTDISQAQVTALDNGQYLLTYLKQGTSGFEIVREKINNNSTSGGQVVIASSIAPLGNDDAVGVTGGGYAYTFSALPPSGTETSFLAYRDAFDRRVFEREITPIGNDPIGVRDLDVTELTNGNLALTWTQGNGATTKVGLQIIDLDGNAVSAKRVVAELDGSSLFRLSEVVALNDGKSMVVYKAATSIEYRIYDADGTVNGPGQRLSSNFVSSTADLAVDKGPDGSVMVMWSDTDSVGKIDFQGRRFDADGNTLGPQFSVFSGPIDASRAVGPLGFAMLENNAVVFSSLDTNTDFATVMSGQGSFTDDVEFLANDAIYEALQMGATYDGSNGNDYIVGTRFDDIILGGRGIDQIFGGDGDDHIDLTEGRLVTNSVDNGTEFAYGGAGRDILETALNNAELYGGGANDLLISDSGQDRLYGDGNNDVLISGSANDMLYGGEGADLLRAGTGNDTAYGETGSDIIRMGQGNDSADGGGAKDTLYGGTGRDTLAGDGGADRLFGGSGNDTLFGGEGSDRFVFNRNDNSTIFEIDIIADFEVGADKIQLKNFFYTSFADFEIDVGGENSIVLIDGFHEIIVMGVGGTLSETDIIFG
ncbi:MAG: calcium-binding protein [Pseudomonadota bacterium]